MFREAVFPLLGGKKTDELNPHLIQGKHPVRKEIHLFMLTSECTESQGGMSSGFAKRHLLRTLTDLQKVTVFARVKDKSSPNWFCQDSIMNSTVGNVWIEIES